MSVNYGSKSVGGGWQSSIAFNGDEWTFGPVFNKSMDLWSWQRDSAGFNAVCAARSNDEALRIASALPVTYHF